MKGSSAMSTVRPVLAMLLWVMMLRTSAGQQVNAKVMRTNIRRDDLYRKEDVITVTAAGGVLHSPRYPSAYPRNLLLSWKLLSPPGARVQLEFDGHFRLEEAENGVCKYDFVEVEDQSETSTIIWGRWCGQKAPPRLTSKSDMLRVTFKSDDYFVAKPGFKVYYSLLYDAPPSQSQQNWNPRSDSVVDDSLLMSQDAQPSQSEPESEEWYPSTDTVHDDSLLMSDYYGTGKDAATVPATRKVPTTVSGTGKGKVQATVSTTVKVLATVSTTVKVPATVSSSTGKVPATAFGTGKGDPAVATGTEGPLSADQLDRTIASFDTVEQLLRTLNPDTWRLDLQSIYTHTHIHYRSRAYLLSSRHNKVDLDRLYDDVKRYSCTPRNYSVNLREELRATSAVFFPRCLLVKRCGGNCGCGTQNWNSGCTCQAAKTSVKLHEVLKYAPEVTVHQRQRRARLRWVLDEIFLTHHDKCECACPSRPPR